MSVTFSHINRQPASQLAFRSNHGGGNIAATASAFPRLASSWPHLLRRLLHPAAWLHASRHTLTCYISLRICLRTSLPRILHSHLPPRGGGVLTASLHLPHPPRTHTHLSPHHYSGRQTYGATSAFPRIGDACARRHRRTSFRRVSCICFRGASVILHSMFGV